MSRDADCFPLPRFSSRTSQDFVFQPSPSFAEISQKRSDATVTRKRGRGTREHRGERFLRDVARASPWSTYVYEECNWDHADHRFLQLTLLSHPGAESHPGRRANEAQVGDDDVTRSGGEHLARGRYGNLRSSFLVRWTFQRSKVGRKPSEPAAVVRRRVTVENSAVTRHEAHSCEDSACSIPLSVRWAKRFPEPFRWFALRCVSRVLDSRL